MEEIDATDAAREGARDGTAVGISSVSPEMIGRTGQEKTGGGAEGAGGRLEEGEGAAAQAWASTALAGALESLTVLSANASISSVEDCVTWTVGMVVKGSGEFLSE